MEYIDELKIGELRAAACSAEQVLMPNRYQEPFVRVYQDLSGLEVPTPTDRKLTIESQGKTFRWVRGRDVPMIVGKISEISPESNAIGFTGSEWCKEYEASDSPIDFDWMIASEKLLGKLTLLSPPSLELPEPDIQRMIRSTALTSDGYRLYQGANLGVVTPYPNLTKRLRQQQKCNVWIETVVNGGVEAAADALGILAIDLVSSGRTIRANNFTIIKELVDVFPAIVTGGAKT